MIIDLTQIREKDVSFDRIIPPTEIDLDDEETRLVEPVEIKGNLRKGIAQVDVEGAIKAKIETSCTRCFRKVETNLEFPFKATFVTMEHYTKEAETELQQDDLDIAVFEGDKLDLREIAREQILLNIPTQILCSAECKGLCEKCGADLNETDCGCAEKEIDPRWQGLRDLQNKN
jgi:Predicted metal-binding, possibly nucleic acid-binding protein